MCKSVGVSIRPQRWTRCTYVFSILIFRTIFSFRSPVFWPQGSFLFWLFRTLRWPLCSNGPIWDRSLPAFDEFRFRRGRVNSFSVTSQSAGRRNHRPRRGERRHCPEDFDGDLSAALSIILFFPVFLDCFSTACARKKRKGLGRFPNRGFGADRRRGSTGSTTGRDSGRLRRDMEKGGS